MHVQKVIDEINRSVPSLGQFNTATMTGFAERLFRQYGTRKVLAALPFANLSPLESGWIKFQAQKNLTGEPIHYGCHVI